MVKKNRKRKRRKNKKKQEHRILVLVVLLLIVFSSQLVGTDSQVESANCPPYDNLFIDGVNYPPPNAPQNSSTELRVWEGSSHLEESSMTRLGWIIARMRDSKLSIFNEVGNYIYDEQVYISVVPGYGSPRTHTNSDEKIIKIFFYEDFIKEKVDAQLALVVVHELTHYVEMKHLYADGDFQKQEALDLGIFCLELRAYALEMAAYWQLSQIGLQNKVYSDLGAELSLSWDWNTQSWSDVIDQNSGHSSD